MAKKFKKSTKSLLNVLLVILALSLFLFGVVFFKINNGNPDVKGDSTASKMPMIKRDGVAGEACGKSVNRACQKNLICAPLGSSYRLLNTQATEVESTTETEGVTTEEKLCLGKTEDEIRTGCLPYIPNYGACVKKGVWPPLSQKPIPSPKDSKKGCESDEDCSNSQMCFQPPMPPCPTGRNCAQVMPVKRCASRVTSTQTATPTPIVTISTDVANSTPTPNIKGSKLPNWFRNWMISR